jgi:hypothetical protein
MIVFKNYRKKSHSKRINREVWKKKDFLGWDAPESLIQTPPTIISASG